MFKNIDLVWIEHMRQFAWWRWAVAFDLWWPGSHAVERCAIVGWARLDRIIG